VVLNLPDFIANAGGVICAAMEYHGASQAAAMETIRDKICANTRAVLEEARQAGILPRQAALHLAQRRIMKAMELKRWGIF
jgi:glutamate dehydrogenase (NAD(P)+)